MPQAFIFENNVGKVRRVLVRAGLGPEADRWQLFVEFLKEQTGSSLTVHAAEWLEDRTPSERDDAFIDWLKTRGFEEAAFSTRN